MKTELGEVALQYGHVVREALASMFDGRSFAASRCRPLKTYSGM